MDHVPRLKTMTARHHCVSHFTTSQRLALFEKPGSCCSVDRTVDTSAIKQHIVRCINNSVDVQ